jgi:hypothetical protein
MPCLCRVIIIYNVNTALARETMDVKFIEALITAFRESVGMENNDVVLCPNAISDRNRNYFEDISQIIFVLSSPVVKRVF